MPKTKTSYPIFYALPGETGARPDNAGMLGQTKVSPTSTWRRTRGAGLGVRRRQAEWVLVEEFSGRITAGRDVLFDAEHAPECRRVPCPVRCARMNAVVLTLDFLWRRKLDRLRIAAQLRARALNGLGVCSTSEHPGPHDVAVQVLTRPSSYLMV